jgi:hypothetical protein
VSSPESPPIQPLLASNTNGNHDMSDEAYSRVVASVLTWPIEKSKLIYQGLVVVPHIAAAARNRLRGRHRHTAASTSSVGLRLIQTSPVHHLSGMASSGIQRGMSAFLMFYAQGHIYQSTKGTTPSYIMDQALAGALSGAVSAPFHTVWELIKVRGGAGTSTSTSTTKGANRIVMVPQRQRVLAMYLTCLVPMVFRHGIFDATFFGVSAAAAPCSDSSGVRFALAAASASLTNLLWDVWKTRQMEHYPLRISFQQVARSMRWRTFLSHYVVKGTDLTANWFAVGYIKDHYF